MTQDENSSDQARDTGIPIEPKFDIAKLYRGQSQIGKRVYRALADAAMDAEIGMEMGGYAEEILARYGLVNLAGLVDQIRDEFPTSGGEPF